MRFTVTRALLHRQPMIRFTGKRVVPSTIDHTPQPHPASGSTSLPSSFAAYRQRAQQHGPLQSNSGESYGGAIGAATGASLGSVTAPKGVFFDVSDLPARFRRRALDVAEMEAIESGGGSLFA